MKVIVCFRHFKCICRKWRKGRDYSWHLHHLLREFGWGPLADLETRNNTVSELKRNTTTTCMLHNALVP